MATAHETACKLMQEELTIERLEHYLNLAWEHGYLEGESDKVIGLDKDGLSPLEAYPDADINDD